MKTLVTTNGLIGAVLLAAIGSGFPGTRVAAANNVVCSGCVNTGDLGKNAVTSAKIDKKTVRPEDMHVSAKPAGADFVETTVDTELTETHFSVVVQSVTIKVPGPGTILATGSGYADPGGSPGSVLCSIVTDTNIGHDYTRADTTGWRTPITRTTAIKVKAKGKVPVNFVCYKNLGDITIHNPHLVAWFVPGMY